jgi:hypothetical protein
MDRGKLLEYIAAALHRQSGLDNQSTTTAGFCDLNKTLYLTSQQNKHYQDLLSVASATFFETPADEDTTAKKYLIFLRNPDDRQALGKQPTIKKRSFEEMLRSVLKFRVTIKDGQEREDFMTFLTEITSVKVVLDRDIYIRTEQHSGFHGESRIVRFLYIKYLKRVTWAELNHPSRQTVGQFEIDFKSRYGGRLWMGSSQGACGYCADLMTGLNIEFSTRQGFSKNREESWRHPLTTTTGTFPKPVYSGLLAPIAVADSGQHKGPKT